MSTSGAALIFDLLPCWTLAGMATLTRKTTYSSMDTQPNRRLRFGTTCNTQSPATNVSASCAANTTCNHTPYCIWDYREMRSEHKAASFECVYCWTERKRPARVLTTNFNEQQAQRMLADPHFVEASLSVQYKMLAFHFAQQRALNFARARQEQCFWIQATDAPPLTLPTGIPRRNCCNSKKRKWSRYHIKQTEGIISLLLRCYDMPYQVMQSHGQEFKEYGIANTSKGNLKAWEFSVTDQSMLEEGTDDIVVVKDFPKTLFWRRPWRRGDSHCLSGGVTPIAS